MTDSSTLEALEARLSSQPKDVLARVDAEIMALTAHMPWIPSPGPQTEAYRSQADVILYGGEPGGGKTDLVLGLSFNEHRRALIMRRRYVDLSGIVDRMIAINGSREGFNGSPPPSLKRGKLTIELGAAVNVGDEQNFIGKARDLLGIDEASQFAEIQVRTLMGWVRSEIPGQRCRVILATNPPLTSEGMWLITMFAPWLDPQYPMPAKPGELRWVVQDDDRGDVWVDGPGAVEVKVNGRMKSVQPTSRTYIPSSVRDNPFYARTGYEKQLDALPPQIREILMGGFKASFKDAEWQIIPTAWIRAAQERWTKQPPGGLPMTAIGVDPSGGGEDPLAIAPLYDYWFDQVSEVPGKQIPREHVGSYTAAQVLIRRRDQAVIVLDMGGGYGSGTYENLRNNDIEVVTYKGAAKSIRRTKDRQLGFFNVRSEAIWAFREALDPDQQGGSSIALPPDQILLSDLTAPKMDPDWNGIKAESKEDIVSRLGRSTNRGDAVIMAWYGRPRAPVEFRAATLPRGRMPQVVMGRRHGR